MRTVGTDRDDKLALVSEEAAEWFVRLKDDGLAEPVVLGAAADAGIDRKQEVRSNSRRIGLIAYPSSRA